MCYHVSNKRSAREMEDAFDARFEDPGVYQPFFHMSGFEHGYLYGIIQEDASLIEPMRWGFVEMQAANDAYYDHRIEEVEDIEGYWRKKGGYSLNGQAERVFDYYVTAEAIRHRRCIIPVTGFYESRHVGKNKYPYHIGPKDFPYLALAGIYNEYDTGFFTCKILTAPANPLMEEIHNSKKRQPVMLHPDNWQRYLESSLSDQQIREVLFTDTNQELEAYTVTKNVTNSRVHSNTAKSVERLEYPELSKGLF
ncbi:SOS response-associated peptidase [Sungkyunkwania multivorans]|uniref:Abasic site processing protein n=1 Tax=Sungkyunkwania multivorans TaxID=1173618 RepID=A0ABW3D0M7_9FLAO